MESTTFNNHILIEDGDVEVKLKTEDDNNKEYEQEPEKTIIIESKGQEEEQFILGYDPDLEFHKEEEDNSSGGELNEHEDPLALPESNTVTVTLGKSHNINNGDPLDEPDENPSTKAKYKSYLQNGAPRKIPISTLFNPLKRKYTKIPRVENSSSIENSSSFTSLSQHVEQALQSSVSKPIPILEPKRQKKNEHSKDRLRQCLLCFETFPTTHLWKQHLRRHAGKSPHFCPCCPSSSTSSFDVWLQHVTGTHFGRLKDLTLPKIPLPLLCCCTACDERFRTKLELKEHMKKVHKKPVKLSLPLKIYKCPHPGCRMEFKKGTPFETHKRKAHRPKPAIVYPCHDPDCPLKFGNAPKRDSHWTEDHKTFLDCPHDNCSLKYEDQEDFDNHLRAHLLPPPVPWTVNCVRCAPTTFFPSEAALKEHFELKHDFSCPFQSESEDTTTTTTTTTTTPTTSKKCPPSFASAFLRNLHMLDVHDCPVESSQYPTLSAASSFLRCNHQGCSVQFKTYRALLAHIKESRHWEHTYKCPSYSCTVNTTTYLQFVLHFHRRPHHDPCNPDFTPGENPWTCPVCLDTKDCRSHPSLLKHALAEHKFRTFPCPFVYSENSQSRENNNNSGDKNSDNDADDVKPLPCGMFFSSFAKLSYHWKFYSEHQPHDPKLVFDWLNYSIPFKCTEPDCTQEFLCQSEFNKHVKSHLPPPKPPKPSTHPYKRKKDYVDTITMEIVDLPPRRRLGPKRKWDYEDIVKTSGNNNNSSESTGENERGEMTESEDENENEDENEDEPEDESLEQVNNEDEPEDFIFQMESDEINEESQEIKSEIKLESEQGEQDF